MAAIRKPAIRMPWLVALILLSCFIPIINMTQQPLLNSIEPIKAGRADAVFGSRMMKGGALEGGMPMWKHNANILLTALENVVLGIYLTEYHSGFRPIALNT